MTGSLLPISCKSSFFLNADLQKKDGQRGGKKKVQPALIQEFYMSGCNKNNLVLFQSNFKWRETTDFIVNLLNQGKREIFVENSNFTACKGFQRAGCRWSDTRD